MKLTNSNFANLDTKFTLSMSATGGSFNINI